VRVVTLQFKILCRRIDRNTWRSYQNIDSLTDGTTDGIIPRVKKIYRILPQSQMGTPTDWYPSIFYKELQKHYINFATITDSYTDGLAPVGI